MKTSQCVLLLGAGLIVGLCLGGNIMGPAANAQGIPNAVATPRFQISAWGTGNGGSGCYIVDTVTGEVWRAGIIGNEKPQKTSEKLVQ